MQLRLAFSVAAHLEPEILIIDEVLSVGDVAFQEKCLGRMEEASQGGTHGHLHQPRPDSVRNLCDRAMLLSRGRVSAIGPLSRGHRRVRGVGHDREPARSLRERETRDGSGELRFIDVRLEREGRLIDSPVTGEDCDIVLSYESEAGRSLHGVNFGITIFALGDSAPMINLSSETAGAVFGEIPATGEARCRLHNCPLPAGQYFMSIWAEQGGVLYDGVHRAFEITISEGDFYGSGRQPHPDHRTVLVPNAWTVTEPSRRGAATAREARRSAEPRGRMSWPRRRPPAPS